MTEREGDRATGRDARGTRTRVIQGLVAACLVAPTAHAFGEAPVEIHSSADRTRVRIGDAVTYRVTAEYDSTLALVTSIPEEALAAFEVRDRRTEEGNAPPGRRRVTEEFEIACYAPGEHEIGARLYLVGSPGGRTDTLTTAALPVEVIRTLPEDAQDIRDIRGPAEIESPFPLRWVIGAGVAALAAAAFLVWFIRRRRRRETEIRLPPPRPAHEVAYEALNELRRLNLPAEGRMKAYYVALSEAVRRYLGARYRLPAMDRTTTELGLLLRTTACDRPWQAEVRNLLEAADRAKFAGWTGTVEAAGESMERALRVVDHTKDVWVEEDAPRAAEG